MSIVLTEEDFPAKRQSCISHISWSVIYFVGKKKGKKNKGLGETEKHNSGDSKTEVAEDINRGEESNIF